MSVASSFARWDSATVRVCVVCSTVVLGLLSGRELVLGDLELESDHVAPAVQVTVDFESKFGDCAVREVGT